MDGDPAAAALTGRAQEGVVAGGEADLDRHRHVEALGLRHRADGADGRGGRLPRDRVLHLGDRHLPRRAEDAVGAVADARRPGETGGEPIQGGDHGRPGTAEQADAPERVVGHNDVVEPLQRLRPRPRRRVDPVAGLDDRKVAVGEREEAEVVIRLDELVEMGERLLDRRRRLVRVEREGGDRPQRHRRHHPERADAHPGRSPPIRVGILARALRSRRRRAQARSSGATRRGSPASLRCRAFPSMPHRPATGRRCHRGWRTPGRSPRGSR